MARTWDRRVLTLGLVMGCALFFLWPALLNRFPFLFFDSAAYLKGGQAFFQAILPTPSIEPAAAVHSSVQQTTFIRGNGVTDARSVYYGVFAQFWNLILGVWGIAFAQALLAATSLVLALHRFGVRSLTLQGGVIIGVGLLTALPFFTSLVMPDFMAGLMVLAISCLASRQAEMGTLEKLYWTAIIITSALFHKSLLLVLFLLIALIFFFGLARRPRLGAAIWLGCSALAAVAGTMLFYPIVERVMKDPVVRTPFLLGRMLEDGTADKILKADCPGAGYRSCMFVPELPITANEFLWGKTVGAVPGQPSGGFTNLGLTDRLAISADQRPIIIQVLKREPVAQVTRSTENFLSQLATLDLKRLEPLDRPDRNLHPKSDLYRITTAVSPKAIEGFSASRIWDHEFPLSQLSALNTATYYFSAFGLGALAILGRRRISAAGSQYLWEFYVIILMGVVLNGAVCGVFSGPIGRYQARLAWLPLFAVAIFLCQRWSRRLPSRADTLPTGP